MGRRLLVPDHRVLSLLGDQRLVGSSLAFVVSLLLSSFTFKPKNLAYTWNLCSWPGLSERRVKCGCATAESCREVKAVTAASGSPDKERTTGVSLGGREHGRTILLGDRFMPQARRMQGGKG